MNEIFQVKTVSSLEKVFWDEELQAKEYTSGSALQGERFSFQAAVRMDGGEEYMLTRVEAETPLHAPVEIREVGQVPVYHPVMKDHDDDYLRTTPGLYPDPLFPHKGDWCLANGQWRCVWIMVDIPKDTPAGDYPITLRFCNAECDNTPLCETTFHLQVIPAVLPEQDLLVTEWFHADCLAVQYGVPVFSEEHWKLLDSYIKHAADFGLSLLLTPVFTPPLDTKIGGERPTVQLVDVTVTADGYAFGFDKLDRYMDMAESHGIRQFEISHLFTQWGAKAAPKIMGTVNGEEKQLFGWDTDAGSDEYMGFLRVFLQTLKAHLLPLGRWERCWFHISDEPSAEMVENYRRAKAGIAKELEGCHVIDALSHYAFYEQGIIAQPIPSNDEIDVFLEKGFPHPWTYYCCGQGKKVSNRFMSMPSYRNRILGYQLYKYQVEGFLQWGFNFWYSCLSRRPINPFIETSARDAFPSGDAFVVYPGEDGQPIPALREVVFCEALQDMRAAQLLESLTDRQTVLDILQRDSEITFTEYPRNSDYLLETREEINRQIARHIAR